MNEELIRSIVDRRRSEAKRCSSAAPEGAGHRANLRHGNHGLRAVDGGIPERSRFCCLAGSCSPTALDRRQTKAWPHLEDGPTRYQKASGHRCNVSRTLEGTWRRKAGPLALKHVRPKAANAGGDRDGKQNDAGGLGYASTQSTLQRSDWSGLLTATVSFGVPAM